MLFASFIHSCADVRHSSWRWLVSNTGAVITCRPPNASKIISSSRCTFSPVLPDTTISAFCLVGSLSPLLLTKIVGTGDVFIQSGSEESSSETNKIISASSIAAFARRTPIISISSSVSLCPAVSIKVNFIPLKSMLSSIVSRVVPLIDDTIALS